MARISKPEEVAAKRNAILDTAQQLVFTKGYEQMSIQDVLTELNISAGAFHHYFDSRGALLKALIERIQEDLEKPILPMIHHPHLTAIEKLQGFFDTLDRFLMEQKASIANLLRVWYTEDNAIVRQNVDETIRKQRAPLLSEIVQQGIREGGFTTPYPEQAGEIVIVLLQGMGNTHAQLLLSLSGQRDEQHRIEATIKTIVATHGAYMDAIERILGAPSNTFRRLDSEAGKIWVTAFRENV